MITKEQYDYFWENGYLVLKKFYSKKELDDFSKELAILIHTNCKKLNINPPPLNDDSIYDKGIDLLEKLDHEYVASLYDTIFQIPAFFRLCGKKETQQVINNLLDKNLNAPLYGFTNRCRIDPPRDERRTCGWHQEIFYTIPKSHFIQTWAPLVRDTTLNNGTIEICVGSHKEGIAKQLWAEKAGYAKQIIVDPDIVSKYKQIKLEMKLGELLLFTGKTFHQSGKNLSNQVRYSLVGLYHDVSSPDFIAPKITFSHRNQDQKEYYNEYFEK
jgi:hypothetical protein